MSTSLVTKVPTFAQRVTAAFEQAGKLLHADDPKRFAAALVEIAVEEMERNPGFRLRVKGHYDQLGADKPVRVAGQIKKSGSPSTRRLEDFVPVTRIAGQSFNMAERLDPYFLYELYGEAQFRDVLNCFVVPQLTEAVQMVQMRNPKTQPKGKSGKATLIDYLVRYVA